MLRSFPYASQQFRGKTTGKMVIHQGLISVTYIYPRGGVLGLKTDGGVPLAAENWTQKDRGKNWIWGQKDRIL